MNAIDTSGNPADWVAVDAYFTALLAPPDEPLHAALHDNERHGLPPHDVSPLQGKLLALLVRTAGAKRVLEIGTLGGYSTIWMARALPPGGSLVTIEANPTHAAVARRNVDRAGLGTTVDLRLGAALDILPQLTGPFDLIFIDADKPNNPEYFAGHSIFRAREH